MRTNYWSRKLLILISLFAASFFADACGGGSGLNQGVPSGTVVSQGTLTGLTCNSVATSATGSAVLYSQGSGDYAINFSGIAVSNTACTSFDVWVLTNTYQECGPLTSNSANSENVSCVALSSQPSSVVLHCRNMSGPSANDCATATLL